MRLIPGVYDTNPETASEFPHGPIIELDNGKCIYFDLHLEEEAEKCYGVLSADHLVT